MSIDDLLREFDSLIPAFEEGLSAVMQADGPSSSSAAALADALEAVRVEFLGRKGRLAGLMATLGTADPAHRPALGQAANRVKEAISARFDQALAALEKAKADALLKHFDPTVPGRAPAQGGLHPITLVMEEVCQVFQHLGFEIVSGPEVETDWYNFEALNMPGDHPARDMQDTLFIQENIVLRTHTSPLQIRTMLARKPPVAAVAPGKVYRRDSDITHTPMFHQIEGFLVDKHVSMAHLRGSLTAFLQALFGTRTKVRFRPSFFPFTEPSAEVDISCNMCGGLGHKGNDPCRVCKTTGWLEILGCGMIDPEVFRAVGYDAEAWSGFAFGMGVERIAMLKYGVGDLRMFFENDARFLRQFA
ncbi:MAG: phenylalanine--tRNA ligase subunit alpha [Desulfovibrio sp.]|nr:phenylalanine--tRNA ligase subunit alpha [Desulfovibrio sp.]MCA1985151.1 phenylalanine--tRNA ligase subunit alpha [Desulfovibrio sp.]